jgi:hypothetical protein
MAPATKKKARHAPAGPPAYEKRARPLKLGQDLRFVLRRSHRKLDPVNLDEFLEHANWERRSGGRTGELNVRAPDSGAGPDLIAANDVVALWAAEAGSDSWRQVWRMKVVKAPSNQIEDGTLAVTLASGLEGHWNESKVAWKIRAGQRAHEVTLAAAQRFRIPVGRIAAGRTRLPKHIEKKATVEDVVGWAYKRERHETGRRFDIDTSRGRIEVLELKYPRFQAVLADMVMSGTLEQTVKGYATAVIVTSSTKVKGKRKARKLRVRVVDRARVRRQGYIVRTVEHAGLKDADAAREWGKKWLARHAVPKRSITVTHPGYPWLDRGHAVTLPLGEETGFVIDGWVQEIRHTVSAGSYEMEAVIGLSDPYEDEKAKKAKKKRDAAAKRRGQKGSGDGGVEAPATKKKARHS